MAGHGPAPKDASERMRRNKVDAPILLTTDDDVRGPDLPETHEWPQPTRDWWDTWRNSPQAQTFTTTDWDFLLDTAVLHAEYWLGDLKQAAELRLRVAKFGATPEDRARLKLTVGEPRSNGTQRLQSKSSSDRKQRLLKVVNDRPA